MENKQENIEEKAKSTSGWKYWIVIIGSALAVKFFGLVGLAVFLGICWIIDYLMQKRA